MSKKVACRGFRDPKALYPTDHVEYAQLSPPTFLERLAGCIVVGACCCMWGGFPLVMVMILVRICQGRYGGAIGWACIIALPHFVRLVLQPMMPSVFGLSVEKKRKSLASRACTAFGRAGQWWFGQGSGVIYQDHESYRGDKHVVMHHPHGIFCLHTVFWYQIADEQPSTLTLIATSLRWFGGLFIAYLERNSILIPADKASVNKWMRSGNTVHLAPGGFQSATHMRQGEDTECVGFGIIKLAMQHGYDLVPEWCFGETETYWNAVSELPVGEQGRKMMLNLNSKGLPTILPFGCAWCPILPRAAPLLSVVGKPVKVPHIANPSREEVTKCHQEYCDALRALYDRYKHVYYGHKDTKLVITAAS